MARNTGKKVKQPDPSDDYELYTAPDGTVSLVPKGPAPAPKSALSRISEGFSEGYGQYQIL